MNIKSGSILKRRLNYLTKYISRRFTRKNAIEVFGNDCDNINIVYVLNLDNQKKRWRSIQSEVKYQKIIGNRNLSHFTKRISAINGSNLNLDKFDSYEVKKQYSLEDYYKIDPDPRLLSILRFDNLKIDLTKQEIAIGLSHIQMWKKMVEEKKSYALFLEDDIFFEKDFANNLNQVWNELPKNPSKQKFDILYLSYEEVKSGMIKEEYSKNLVKPIGGIWWFSGYVLSLTGAQKLLDELPVRAPIDVWINFIFNKLDVFAIKRPIINQREDIESDNVYSILSMLNQAKKKYDKRKGRSPIFVLAENETISTLFGDILDMLGYSCCINRWGEFTQEVISAIDEGSPLLFDAHCGFDKLLLNHKKIKSTYPNTLFIIVKDTKGIIQNHSTNDYPFEQAFKSISDNHKNRTIILDIDEFNIWDELCHFLDCEIPSFPLPKNELLIKAKTVECLNLKDAILKPVQSKKYQNLDFDESPWIFPVDNMKLFKDRQYPAKNARMVGNQHKILEDDFSKLDQSIWIQLEDTFEGNLSLFTKENYSILDNNGCKFALREEKSGHRNYSSASILTKKKHHYGKFEVEMKPAKGNGIVSAFFLFRYNPWQEIDIEFLGDDTTKIMLNVYYNPGVEGITYNYGNKSAPIKIDLGFDASIEYHKYAIEWEPHEIRWYVDDTLIHVRRAWEPTPIPNLPMQFYLNIWAPDNKEFAGDLSNTKLPQSCFVKQVTLYSWSNRSVSISKVVQHTEAL
ncbi:family 16 glycosylhydrolase [Croceitalea marina]|uniref:Beta-glucanase n=1 Tax=Croceitalea marina TaxID=1775166 RepID=A0ABW5MXY5_9FLAO